MARIPTRLRRAARSVRRALTPRTPFITHHLSCADGTTLHSVIEMRSDTTKPTLTTTHSVLTEMRPTEVHGRVAQFEIDLTPVLDDLHVETLELRVKIGARSYPFPRPDRSAVADGPLHRRGTWMVVEPRSTRAVLARRGGEAISLVRDVTSTPTGIRVVLSSSTSALALHSEGQRFDYEPDAGGIDVDLTALPLRDHSDPTYWHASTSDETGERPLLVDNGDLTNPSYAYNIPMLVFRDPDDAAYYAKPFFARADGRLTIRTGRWQEAPTP